MTTFLNALIPDCCRHISSNNDDTADMYKLEDRGINWEKIGAFFSDAETIKKDINDFSHNIDSISSMDRTLDDCTEGKNNYFDGIFQHFDLIKNNAKSECKDCFNVSYSLQENAILFSIGDDEVKSIEIQNDAGSDEIILNGVNVNQWVFLSACQRRSLKGFNEMIDALFPIFDLSTLTKQDGVKSLLEYDYMDNTCPEKSALVLAKFHNIDCEFILDDVKGKENQKLKQIDISIPFECKETHDYGRYFTAGHDKNAGLQHLNELNKENPHIFRTGMIGGDGHNRVLNYEKEGWFLYETLEDKHQLTERDLESSKEYFTDYGLDIFFKPYASWGAGHNQSSIVTLETTKESTQALIDMIKTCRREGENIAEKRFN